MKQNENCFRLQEQLCAFVKHTSINFQGDEARLHQFIQRVVNSMHEADINKLKRFLLLYSRLKGAGKSIISIVWCDKRVLKAKEFIDQNYCNELRLSEIASNVGLTKATLSRLFHQHLSITFTVYVINYRINKSIPLLLESDLTISEIGYRCGFNSYRDFNRTFKKIKYTSPGGYRKSGRLLLKRELIA